MTISAGSPREPSAVLVMDANIALGILLGRRPRPVFETILTERQVILSSHAADEIRTVVRSDARCPDEVRELAETLFGEVTVVDPILYEHLMLQAGQRLGLAVPSRDGSRSDAHVLACAWTFDADIWSHDRDFAGTGWPSWSNANLMSCLDASERERRGP